MKKVYAVIIQSGTQEGTDVCALMADADSRTAFIGCWEIPDDFNEMNDRISSMIDEFYAQPDFDRVIFGCTPNAADDIIGKVSCEVERIDIRKLTMLL